MRRAVGLRWAKRFEGWPEVIPHPRPRRGSAKAAGIAFEKAMRASLTGVESVWFQYSDAHGIRWCQVDGLYEGTSGALVLEAKLTWVPEAQEKLDGLYLPVVRMALGKPAVGVVVARRLVPGLTGRVCQSLPQAIEVAKRGQPAVWHWLGVAAAAA